jgi:hypothetical protein
LPLVVVVVVDDLTRRLVVFDAVSFVAVLNVCRRLWWSSGGKTDAVLPPAVQMRFGTTAAA